MSGDLSLEAYHWCDVALRFLEEKRRTDCLDVADDCVKLYEFLNWGESSEADRAEYEESELFSEDDSPPISDRDLAPAIINAASMESFNAAFRAISSMLGVDASDLQQVGAYWFERGPNLRSINASELMELLSAASRDRKSNPKDQDGPSLLLRKMDDLKIEVSRD